MLDLMKYPIKNTAKSYKMLDQNKYVFAVDSRLTKLQIKKLFEKLFNVKIRSVNTHITPVEKKKLGLQQGYKPRYKRAIITLKKGERKLYKEDKKKKVGLQQG